jgi:hypothetical protein
VNYEQINYPFIWWVRGPRSNVGKFVDENEAIMLNVNSGTKNAEIKIETCYWLSKNYQAICESNNGPKKYILLDCKGQKSKICELVLYGLVGESIFFLVSATHYFFF